MKTLPKVTVAVAGAALIVGAGVALALDDVASPRPIELSAVSDTRSSDAASADETPQSTDPSGADHAQEPTGSSIDETEARRLAIVEVGDGEVVHVRADRDDGRAEWEVLVRDEQGVLVEVTLDAADGRVLEVDVEDDDDLPSGVDVTVTEAEAREAALAATGGGEVVRARADLDDGRAEWELDVVDADGRLVEVTIDGTDGSVLEVDVED